jgi:serine/threonine protein kinase
MVLAGKYVLESFLGSGAMGDVWRARHASIGTPFAVKLVSSTDRGSEATLRLLTEARAAAQIVSPYVVRVFDHGEEQGVAYIAMELLEGETLAARIERAGPIAPERLATIVLEVARGLTTVHEHRTVHRDLKPENIYLARTPEGEVAKLVDFGVAKSLTDPASLKTHQGIVVGTPAYLSPEQILGGQPLDARADLWALAVVAYESLTGRLPYDAPSMAALFAQIVGRGAENAAAAPDLTPEFAAWFRRATHRDPTQRFGSPLELAETLTMAIAPEHPWLEGTLRPVAPARLSSRAVLGISALAGLTVVLLAIAVRASMARSPTTAPSSPLLGPSASAIVTAGGVPSPSTSESSSPFLPRPKPSGAATTTATPAPAALSASPSPSSSAKPGKRVDRWAL